MDWCICTTFPKLLSDKPVDPNSRWRVNGGILVMFHDQDRGGILVYRIRKLEKDGRYEVDIEDLGYDFSPERVRPYERGLSRVVATLVARRAGHSFEQITAALTLADSFETSDEFVYAETTDEEYKRLVTNGKKRIAYYLKKTQKRRDKGSSTN